jgi:hypothetical protein
MQLTIEINDKYDLSSVFDDDLSQDIIDEIAEKITERVIEDHLDDVAESIIANHNDISKFLKPVSRGVLVETSEGGVGLVITQVTPITLPKKMMMLFYGTDDYDKFVVSGARLSTFTPILHPVGTEVQTQDLMHGKIVEGGYSVLVKDYRDGPWYSQYYYCIQFDHSVVIKPVEAENVAPLAHLDLYEKFWSYMEHTYH